jgi:DMSO/TMAO reductase YedYZ molybdopterin-dependent catalytic subunit
MPYAEGSSIEPAELALGVRNHAMPQEALRYDVTPAGLHYLLIHYDIPAVDRETFRLTIGGHVRRPLTLSIDDLRARPSVTATVTLECAGNGRALLHPRPISQPWLLGAVGNAVWTGTPLAPLLAEARPVDGAVDVAFAGLDHGIEGDVEQDYERGLPLHEATRPEAFLAYEMNGQPLLPQHGFPLRLVIPGWYGMAHVKWLTRITVLDEPFGGYQNMVSYRRQRDEDDVPGQPVQRIRVRSLIEPPGFTRFNPRMRIVDEGRVRLRGRAWCGSAPVARVEVSTDGGATWRDAELGPSGDPYAWRSWSLVWDAEPGEHVLCSRATDADGRSQPEEPEWNVGGFENNAIERMPVQVRAV